MINRFRCCICCALVLTLQFILPPFVPIAAAEMQVGATEPKLVALNDFDQPRDEWTDIIDEAIDSLGGSPSKVEPTPNEKPEDPKEEVAPEPSSESLNREGAALVKSGSMVEAVSKFNDALELDPSHIGARFNLAFAYQRMERLDEAESEYRKVLEIKDLTRAHVMLGLLYKKEGEESKAIKEFETVLKEEPDNKVALIRLKELRKKELEKAQRIEAERIEAERVEAERVEAERVEAERVEAARVEAARVEAERVEAERVEAERVEAARVEAERVEAERVEAERVEAERVEAARVEAVRVEAERVEAERVEAERVEAARVEAERVEAARVEAERVEAERVEAERVEAERVEAERVEAARLEAERIEAERVEAARVEAERVEAERVEAERVEAERVEAERVEAERIEAERVEAARVEAERIEAERVEAARVEAERVEAERVEAERIESTEEVVEELTEEVTTKFIEEFELERAARVEAARVEAERVEAERVEAERVEAARVEAERVEAERVEAERVEAERVEAERVEAERVEAARIEASRIEAERVEAERVEAVRVEAARVEAVRVEAARVEAARIEAERIEAERVEAARVEAERVEAARVEAERVEAARVEAARVEAERVEAARVEAARVEAARVEAERVEAARVEAERVEAERIESTEEVVEELTEEVTTKFIEEFELERAARVEAERVEAEREKAAEAEYKRKIAEEEIATQASSESLNREGAALVKSGSMAEAVSKFLEALELDPSHIGARFNLAFAYQRMERLEEAESEYRKVLEKKDITRAHLMLGLLYEKEGESDKAVNEFETVLKEEPDNKVALTRLKELKNNELEKAERVESEQVESEQVEAEQVEAEQVEAEWLKDEWLETERKKYSLARLIGMTEIPVLADVDGQFVDSMAENQILEGEFAIEVDETGLLESIRTGRSFNRESRAALARTEQAKAQTDQAFALLLPSVSVRASHGEETSEPSVVPDPITNELVSDTHMRTDASLTITQPLYNLPTFLDWRRRQAKEEARRESYRVSDGDAYISTVNAYLSLVSSRLQADVMREFALKLTKLLSYIKKRAAAGAASVSDMSRVRARTQKALSSRLEQESAHAAAGTEFVRLTNIVPQMVRLPKFEDIGYSFLPESLELAVTTAMQSNPEVATLAAELKAEKISKSAAEGRYLPSVDAEYTDTYSDHAGGSDDSQRDKRLMLVLNWKLLSGGKDYKYNVERIARYKELQYRMDDERRRVVQALAANYAELTTTSERIISGYEELESISIAVEAMSKRMLSGDQSLLDLLTVYDNYYKLRARLIKLHILEMNTAAQLIRLTLGTPWPATEQGQTSILGRIN